MCESKYKLGIIIQGPMNDFADMVDLWLNVNIPDHICVIVSTWKDSIKKEHVLLFESIGWIVIQSDPPEHAGYHNINYQTKSTTVGIEVAKNQHCTHIFKIRADYIPIENSGIKLTDLLYKRWLLDNETSAHYILCYYQDFANHQYCCDFIYFNDIEHAKIFWNVTQPESDLCYPERYLMNQAIQNLPNIPYRTLLLQFHECQMEFYRLKWRAENIDNAFLNIAGHMNWIKNKINGVSLTSLDHNYQCNFDFIAPYLPNPSDIHRLLILGHNIDHKNILDYFSCAKYCYEPHNMTVDIAFIHLEDFVHLSYIFQIKAKYIVLYHLSSIQPYLKLFHNTYDILWIAHDLKTAIFIVKDSEINDLVYLTKSNIPNSMDFIIDHQSYKLNEWKNVQIILEKSKKKEYLNGDHQANYQLYCLIYPIWIIIHPDSQEHGTYVDKDWFLNLMRLSQNQQEQQQQQQ